MARGGGIRRLRERVPANGAIPSPNCCATFPGTTRSSLLNFEKDNPLDDPRAFDEAAGVAVHHQRSHLFDIGLS